MLRTTKGYRVLPDGGHAAVEVLQFSREAGREGVVMLIKLASAGALALALGGCATITKGTTQNVGVDTPGVTGAVCTVTSTVGPQTVSTPGVFILAKSSAALPVKCTKACYHDSGGILGSTFEAMTAGNLIVGGVIGFGVDAISGAINKYPDQISIPMVPIPGCGGPPPAPGRQRSKGIPPVAVRPAPPPVTQPQIAAEPEPQLSEADRTMMQRN